MKKLLTLILALVLLLTLPGCGLLGKLMPKISAPETLETDEYSEPEYSDDGEYSEPEYSDDGEYSEPDYGDDYDYSSTDTIYGEMTAEEKAAFIESAALSGTTVTFNADGSTTFVYDDGSVTIQNADGTWTYSDEDGTATTQFGGNWPDNEFTRLLPKPDFDELFGAVTEEKTFTVLFTESDTDQMRAYIEAVKVKGFTINPDFVDDEAFGVIVLSYTATNAAGYKVELASAMGINTITVSKD